MEPFEIRPLHVFTREEILPIVSGYETGEIYSVEKTETDERTVFDIRLVRLGTPHKNSFESDFTPRECENWQRLVPHGYCFGAYQGENLIGFAIGEEFPEERELRVWEFHVMDGFRRIGVGRALMERVLAKAREKALQMVKLETQNTNVNAIRFYRRLGFSIHLVDLSHYFHLDGEASQEVAFYMKQRVQ